MNTQTGLHSELWLKADFSVSQQICPVHLFFDITWAFLGGPVVLVNFFVSFFAVCRLPLANREYIKTAGLRSTVAWAMASLAEISVSECSLQRNGVLNEGEGGAAHWDWSWTL